MDTNSTDSTAPTNTDAPTSPPKHAAGQPTTATAGPGAGAGAGAATFADTASHTAFASALATAVLVGLGSQ